MNAKIESELQQYRKENARVQRIKKLALAAIVYQLEIVGCDRVPELNSVAEAIVKLEEEMFAAKSELRERARKFVQDNLAI